MGDIITRTSAIESPTPCNFPSSGHRIIAKGKFLLHIYNFPAIFNLTSDAGQKFHLWILDTNIATKYASFHRRRRGTWRASLGLLNHIFLSMFLESWKTLLICCTSFPCTSAKLKMGGSCPIFYHANINNTSTMQIRREGICRGFPGLPGLCSFRGIWPGWSSHLFLAAYCTLIQAHFLVTT